MNEQQTSLAGERTHDGFNRGRVNFKIQCSAWSGDNGARCEMCEGHPLPHRYAPRVEPTGNCSNCGYGNVIKLEDGQIGCEDCGHHQAVLASTFVGAATIRRVIESMKFELHMPGTFDFERAIKMLEPLA